MDEALFRKYGNDNDNERVFFYNQNVEVDFYIPDDELAIQVSYSIEGSDTTQKREVEALQKLPRVLSCKRRVIITYDEEKTIEDEYGVIEIHFARGNTEYVYLRNFSKKHKKRQPFRVAFIFLGLRD